MRRHHRYAKPLSPVPLNSLLPPCHRDGGRSRKAGVQLVELKSNPLRSANHCQRSRGELYSVVVLGKQRLSPKWSFKESCCPLVLARQVCIIWFPAKTRWCVDCHLPDRGSQGIGRAPYTPPTPVQYMRVDHRRLEQSVYRDHLPEDGLQRSGSPNSSRSRPVGGSNAGIEGPPSIGPKALVHLYE